MEIDMAEVSLLIVQDGKVLNPEIVEAWIRGAVDLAARTGVNRFWKVAEQIKDITASVPPESPHALLVYETAVKALEKMSEAENLTDAGKHNQAVGIAAHLLGILSNRVKQKPESWQLTQLLDHTVNVAVALVESKPALKKTRAVLSENSYYHKLMGGLTQLMLESKSYHTHPGITGAVFDNLSYIGNFSDHSRTRYGKLRTVLHHIARQGEYQWQGTIAAATNQARGFITEFMGDDSGRRMDWLLQPMLEEVFWHGGILNTDEKWGSLAPDLQKRFVAMVLDLTFAANQHPAQSDSRPVIPVGMPVEIKRAIVTQLEERIPVLLQAPNYKEGLNHARILVGFVKTFKDNDPQHYHSTLAHTLETLPQLVQTNMPVTLELIESLAELHGRMEQLEMEGLRAKELFMSPLATIRNAPHTERLVMNSQLQIFTPTGRGGSILSLSPHDVAQRTHRSFGRYLYGRYEGQGLDHFDRAEKDESVLPLDHAVARLIGFDLKMVQATRPPPPVPVVPTPQARAA